MIHNLSKRKKCLYVEIHFDLLLFLPIYYSVSKLKWKSIGVGNSTLDSFAFFAANILKLLSDNSVYFSHEEVNFECVKTFGV